MLLSSQHGIDVGTKLASAGVRALHFYTMNLEVSVTAILKVCFERRQRALHSCALLLMLLWEVFPTGRACI